MKCIECFQFPRLNIEQINVTVIEGAQKGCLCELNTFVTVALVLKSGELILHPLWAASIRKGGGQAILLPSYGTAIYCLAWY